MNQVCSSFSQLLELFARMKFQKAVPEHQAERHARGFTCWRQFVALAILPTGAGQIAPPYRRPLSGLRARRKVQLSKDLWWRVCEYSNCLLFPINYTSVPPLACASSMSWQVLRVDAGNLQL